MKSKIVQFTLPLYLCSGIIIGLLFPVFFVFLDLKQLNIGYSIENTYTVFKSQNIYIFSLITFPSLFAIIGYLFFKNTQQKNKLQEHEKYLNDVMNSLNDGILVCDHLGNLKYANWMFYKQYNSHFKNLESFLNIKNINEISPGYNADYIVTNSNDEKRVIHFTIYKLHLHKKNYQDEKQFIISITDVDELRKNKETIETQNAQLLEASKLSALGQMASGFAHEINNPLAVINGRVDISLRELKKEKQDNSLILKNLEVCKSNISRITKIISSLKNLSHSDPGNLEVVTIKTLVDDALTILNLKITGKDIKFNLHISEIEDATIMCNSVQISQVLINLLSNAIDEIENKESPWLSFSVEQDSNNFIFKIMDSGPGIPLEVQKKIFNPMFTTKPIGKGTGLGLSISRAIVEKHGGTLRIDNECKNTCFEVQIPKRTLISQAA